MGRLLMDHKEEIVRLQAREIGKTLKECGGEVQEAIDTCPVDCIHWVQFEELDDLEKCLDRDMFQSFGKPPRMNKH